MTETPAANGHRILITEEEIERMTTETPATRDDLIDLVWQAIDDRNDVDVGLHDFAKAAADAIDAAGLAIVPKVATEGMLMAFNHAAVNPFPEGGNGSGINAAIAAGNINEGGG